MTTSSRREIDEEGRLDEQYVQDAFHSFLKSSLAHAKAENLLDIKILSSAEADLMITGSFIQAERTIHDPLIVTRARIMSLLRSAAFHHRSSFSPYSSPRRQSQGRARIVSKARYDSPLARQLSRSLHALPQALGLLRSHHSKTRTATATRPCAHYL